MRGPWRRAALTLGESRGGACHGWQLGQILHLRADAHVMSECSDQEEAAPVVTLWGRQWNREALPGSLLARQMRAPEEESDGKR